MMRQSWVRMVACSLLTLLVCFQPVSARHALADPPFWGTIFISSQIITSDDPSLLNSVTYTGRGMRVMFDRRANDWVTLNAFLFDAVYDNRRTIEIQVNPEFGSADKSLAEARVYADVIGRLPRILFKDLKTVWIHAGVYPFGGGNNNILIHTG